jgi:glutamate synthase domain-containing protein 3
MKAAYIERADGNGGYKLIVGNVAKIWAGVMTILGAGMVTGMINMYARLAVLEERTNAACINMKSHMDWEQATHESLLTDRVFKAEMAAIREELNHVNERISNLESGHTPNRRNIAHD